MINIAIFISGRGSNFKAINESIKSGFIKNAKIVFVASDNINALGLQYARENNIPQEIIDISDKKTINKKILKLLIDRKIDLICLAGYMRIIGKLVINEFKDKIMNIHPSLLPSFPGLNAQKQALDYGVKITGCTLHFVDDLIDHGPIILQKAVEVDSNDNVDTLSNKILQYEHQIYPLGIKLFVEKKLSIHGRKVIIL
jgi:phosphoribosylglycinamide formyltransferase-1